MHTRVLQQHTHKPLGELHDVLLREVAGFKLGDGQLRLQGQLADDEVVVLLEEGGVHDVEGRVEVQEDHVVDQELGKEQRHQKGEEQKLAERAEHRFRGLGKGAQTEKRE